MVIIKKLCWAVFKRQTAVIELLMTGMRMPETWWAIFKWQVINLRNCCIWLVHSFECMMMHGLANPKFTICTVLLIGQTESEVITSFAYKKTKQLTVYILPLSLSLSLSPSLSLSFCPCVVNSKTWVRFHGMFLPGKVFHKPRRLKIADLIIQDTLLNMHKLMWEQKRLQSIVQ